MGSGVLDDRCCHVNDPFWRDEADVDDDFVGGRLLLASEDLEACAKRELAEETGVNLGVLCQEEIDTCVGEGWLTQLDARLKLTDRGVLFADAVARAMLS